MKQFNKNMTITQYNSTKFNFNIIHSKRDGCAIMRKCTKCHKFISYDNYGKKYPSNCCPHCGISGH